MEKKRKKKGFILLFIRAVFEVLGWIFKGIFRCLSWMFTRLKGTIQKRKALSARPKVTPVYQALIEVKKKRGNLALFEKILYSPGRIGIILGARGSGKSALGMRIAENVQAKTSKDIYAMGFAEEKLPYWIQGITTIDAITNDSCIIIDESGINFSSRSSMSSANKLLTDLLLIARHKNVSIVFITQNSSNIEINTLRQADYLLLKPSSLLQNDFERKKIKEIYQSIEHDFEGIQDIGVTYVYADAYLGFVKNSLPSFWSEGLSKSFANKK